MSSNHPLNEQCTHSQLTGFWVAVQIPLEDDLLEEEGLGAATAAAAVATVGSTPDRGGFSSVLRFSSSSSELDPSAVCFLISAFISLPGEGGRKG